MNKFFNLASVLALSTLVGCVSGDMEWGMTGDYGYCDVLADGAFGGEVCTGDLPDELADGSFAFYMGAELDARQATLTIETSELEMPVQTEVFPTMMFDGDMGFVVILPDAPFSSGWVKLSGTVEIGNSYTTYLCDYTGGMWAELDLDLIDLNDSGRDEDCYLKARW
jgi:hypothetical protein